MKKIILGLAVITFIGASSISCKCEKKETQTKQDIATEHTYACPMQCEGDKTYTAKSTKCPECKMSLVVVKHDMKGHSH
ncbi:MAG: hypothetical protein KAH07_05795 [Flavobacteriaceae bacterium]|nr:hypothetical protein [Flavobacteriaceae bacterium]